MEVKRCGEKEFLSADKLRIRENEIHHSVQRRAGQRYGGPLSDRLKGGNEKMCTEL